MTTPISSNPTILYFLGDQHSPKHLLLDELHLTPQPQNAQLNIYLSHNEIKNYQIYDFPQQDFLCKYCTMYLGLLPQPIAVLYCLSIDSTSTQLKQWIGLFNECKIVFKLIFISDAKSYGQRQLIIARLVGVFECFEHESIYFPNMGKQSIVNMIDNVEQIGVLVNEYCLAESVLEKVRRSIRGAAKKLIRSVLRLYNCSKQAKSVI